jgi:hypothetical protein
MVAGTLASAGYFVGDSVYPARASNPKGFFEDKEFNSINEALLARSIPGRPRIRPRRLRRRLFRSRPLYGQRWLARVPLGTPFSPTPDIARRMDRITRIKPYCFKDPRLCYTLPAWAPYVDDAVFICVFRDPATTAQSILTECGELPYLRSLAIDFDGALEVWTLMYRHVLEEHQHTGEWLFLHFNQVLTETGLARIEALTKARLDRTFPDATLQRSSSRRAVAEETSQIYARLMEMAGYVAD